MQHNSVKNSASCKKQVKKKKREKKEKYTFLSKTAIRTSNGRRYRSRLRKLIRVRTRRDDLEKRLTRK